MTKVGLKSIHHFMINNTSYTMRNTNYKIPKEKIRCLLKQTGDILAAPNEVNLPSLYKGTGGIALFYSILLEYDNCETWQKQFDRYFKNTTESLNNIPLPSSLGMGFTGIFWLIRFLNEKAVLSNNDLKEMEIDNLDDLVIQSIWTDENNFDLFYGFIGKVVYLLRKENNEDILIQVVSIIDSLKTQTEDGFIFWADYDEKSKHLVNMGLAHGMPSIIIILSRIYKKISSKEVKKQIEKLVSGAINWLLCQKNISECQSIFPTASQKSHRENQNSRLAWCYGDLGIAWVLVIVSDVFKNKDWLKEAHLIITHSCKRRLPESGLYMDTSFGGIDVGLCHGLSSIVYLYHKLYQKTKLRTIKKMIDFWLGLLIENFEKILIEAKTKDRKIFTYDENYFIIDEYSFLEGISGVGIVLISLISPKKNNWDDILLLSDE